MEIHPLFPVAVTEHKLGRDFSILELKAISEQEYIRNTNNSISVSKDILNNISLLGIKDFISSALSEYLQNIICPATDCELYITQSWLNVTQKGEAHPKHRHRNSIISGVLYISVDLQDRIIFTQNDPQSFDIYSDNLNLYNTLSWWLPTKKFSLLLFPSHLQHEVGIKETDGNRISLSFNTFFKGKIGESTTATELSI